MASSERIRRIAAGAGFRMADEPEAATILVDDSFVFHSEWLRLTATSPGMVVTVRGVPVLGHATDARMAQNLAHAFWSQNKTVPAGCAELKAEQHQWVENTELRKREPLWILRLYPESVRSAEAACFKSSYKGVTDLLTKYLWPDLALVLTRSAASLGLTPNMVTTIGLLLCIAATFAFAEGAYWLGMATGFAFMVLDTVDGKLARCTLTSSWWGNVFDHGIDLIHPPIWWWAWMVGLASHGLALSARAFDLVLGSILVAYVVQRLIEGAFIKQFGMHIHVWRPIDSDFRSITARRNPNMALLVVFLAIGRPDWGIVAVAIWSVLSCIFHLVRLAQANVAYSHGQAPKSWLAA